MSSKISEFIFAFLKVINSVIWKKNLILFTSSPNYYDNAFMVFEYLYKNYKNTYRIIWLLENDNKIIRFDGVQYVRRHSLMGIYYFFRAKYVFHTHGLYLNATSQKQKVFSLWHGMPLKKIQHLFPNDMKKIANRKLDFELTIATSEHMAKIMSLCFGCSVEKVKVTGLPRNDLLFRRDRFLNLTEKEKVIVWMPTYRDGNARKEGTQYIYGIPLINSENIFEIDNFCRQNNLKIIIKLHPFQRSVERFPALNNVVIVDNSIVVPGKHFYNYLGSADALLTDYSSVYIDFLSVDKPIGFILDDYMQYSDDRGFVFDNPLENMPGNHIYNLEDLKMFIYEIANGIDSTKNLRDTIGIKLNKFRDANNTERVLNEIIPFIKK